MNYAETYEGEVQQVVNDKVTMYGALLRNQRWTPKLKEPIMTAEFMRGVKEGQYWLPKTDEIRLLNCADPPPKHVIANILCDKMMHFPP